VGHTVFEVAGRLMVLSLLQYLLGSLATTIFSHGIYICLSCYCWSVVSKSDDVQVSLNSGLRSWLIVNRSTLFGSGHLVEGEAGIRYARNTVLPQGTHSLYDIFRSTPHSDLVQWSGKLEKLITGWISFLRLCLLFTCYWTLSRASSIQIQFFRIRYCS
jgi:hypothetical protein